MRIYTYLLRRFQLLVSLLAALTITLGVMLTRAPGRAVSAELSPLETRLLGQSRWLSGGPAALRLITSDHRSGHPLHARTCSSPCSAWFPASRWGDRWCSTAAIPTGWYRGCAFHRAAQQPG